MKTLEGQLTAQGMKVAIVVARFNEFITSKLFERCYRLPGTSWDGQ